MTRPAPTFTSWDELPLICDLSHVAQLYGKTPSAVQKAVYKGTFPVAPCMVRPLRWNRSDLEAVWNGTQAAVRHRRSA